MNEIIHQQKVTDKEQQTEDFRILREQTGFCLIRDSHEGECKLTRNICCDDAVPEECPLKRGPIMISKQVTGEVINYPLDYFF